MLCRISTGKSGRNWLDKLRISKGFPVENGLDLEQFLYPSPSSSIPGDVQEDKPESSEDQPEKPGLDTTQKKKEEWFEILSDALSELFNMGDPRDCPSLRAKSERKQSKPKIFVLSGASVGFGHNSPCSADNSVAEPGLDRYDATLKKRGLRKESIASAKCANSKEETVDADLSSFSRTEVTVIDTSCPTWKAEKLIFRKGSVWKIRDKKKVYNGLDNISSRKRRKMGQFERFLNRKEDSIKEYLKKKGGHGIREGYRDDSKLEDFKGSTGGSNKVHERRKVCLGTADHLSPDHPINQPTGTLEFSIYQVFQQAGKMGLTAREAVSRILDEGLPGIHEGGVVPRVEVAKFLRNSPYFLQLEESKFALCSEITANEGLLSPKVVTRRLRTSRQCLPVSGSARSGYPPEEIEEKC